MLNIAISFFQGNKWILIFVLSLIGALLLLPPRPTVLPELPHSQPQLLPITGAIHDAVWDAEKNTLKATGSDPYFWPQIFPNKSIMPNNFDITPLASMRMIVESLSQFNENGFQVYYLPADKSIQGLSEKYKVVGVPGHVDGKLEITWRFPVLIVGGRIDIPDGAVIKINELRFSPGEPPFLYNKTIRRILSLILFIVALILTIFWYFWNVHLYIVERRLLGLSSLVLLILWSFISYADAGTSGEQGVRLFVVFLVCGIVILEFLKPWWGFYLFLLIWPFMYGIREILIMMGGPVWNAFLETGSGIVTITSPMTAALSIGCWLRIERYLHGQINDSKCARKNIWIEMLRIAFWVIVISYIISCLIVTFKLRKPPSDWFTVPSYWNHLLITEPYSTIAPLWNTLNTLPPLFLGLLLISYLNMRSDLSVFTLPPFPVKRMTAISAVAGIIMGGHVLFQIVTNIQWPFFNDVQPSGPFENRDLVSPILVVFGMLCIQLPTARRISRAGFVIAGTSLIGISLLTSCRNALFMVLLIPLFILLIHANRRKIALVISLLIIMMLIVYTVPLKQFEKIPNLTIQRTVDTLKVIRTSGLGAALVLDARGMIYSTALKIWQDYPLTGAGPMSFVMLTHLQARYGSISRDLSVNLCHAHNIPLQLLAEVGPFASLAWIVLWIIWPLLALMLWQHGNLKALTVLMIGLGSQFEYLWRAPGMTTFSVLLIIWAVASYTEELNDSRLLSS